MAWRSLLGVVLILALGWVLSERRRAVSPRTVGAGLALMGLLALFVFVLPVGRGLFLFLNSLVEDLLEAALRGPRFLFGPLAEPPGAEGSLGFILATQALPTVVFFASLMGGLYWLGLMPALVRLFARVFSALMRSSGAESLCAASNIFVGVESATTIRPYLGGMTRSELCTVLTAGMATIASSVLGLYVLILRDAFPTIAGHLISASVLSAPAAVVMAKLLVPETQEPLTMGRLPREETARASSLIEALTEGAMAGLRLLAGIVALLLAYLGLLALLDMLLAAGGRPLGLELSLTGLLSWLMYPLALAMGVPSGDALEVARLLGMRVVATEVPAYQALAGLMREGLIGARAGFIAAYALCGFSHVASLAVFSGGFSALAPQRAGDIARVAPRALLAANLACLLTLSLIHI